MHTTELRLDIETARQMIHNQFPDFRGERIEELTTGTDHAIVRIGSYAAARFPLLSSDPAVYLEALRRQAGAMIELAECCPVLTPRPLGLGQPGRSYSMPWMVQTWVDGAVATPSGLASSRTFALELAGLVDALRQADVRGRQFDGGGRGGRLLDHDRWMATCFDRSEGLLEVPLLRRIWAQFRELPAAQSVAMSHKDLIPGNLLVDGERLVGVIDGGGFGPADPALDLVVAWHLLDNQRRDDMRNCLGSSDLEWRRGAAWAFQQAMGLVWYYERSNPTMSALGCSTLGRIAADPTIWSGRQPVADYRCPGRHQT